MCCHLSWESLYYHYQHIKRKGKDYKLYDGDGLYLIPWSNPSCKKQWRLDYRLQGIQKTISLNRYPDVLLTLAQDLKLRNKAKKKLRSGINPSRNKRKLYFIYSVSQAWVNTV